MKCSNPHCNRGIGLVHHRRGWFSKRRYCSRNCSYAFVADLPSAQKKPSATTYFEWLFLQPIGNPQEKLVPAVIPIIAKGKPKSGSNRLLDPRSARIAPIAA